MKWISKTVGKLGQNKWIGEIAEYDPATARLMDRTMWLVITGLMGRGIDYLSSFVIDGEHSLAMLATSVLYLRQAWASKQYREDEKDEALTKPTN